MIRQGKYTRKVTKARQAKRAGRRGWRWFRNLSKPKKFLVIAGPILAFLILTPLLTYLYYANDIADQERLMNRNNTGVVLTDRNGETFYSVGRAAHRKMVPLSDMSKSVKDAVIAAEDKDFYKHEGFSIGGILRSLFNNVATQSITGGGSTLTQQLAKNTLLSENQTFLRKYQELFIAIAIEQQYTKDQILEMYLNSVFYGENAFGIEDAAKTYFGKTPKDLTLAESAMLIGVLPAPSAYSPITGNPEYAKERQTTVLTRMVNNGYITEAEKQAALAEQLAYAPQDATNNSEAPHYAEMVMQELYNKYGEETVTRSGYQVKTTLDLNLQRQLKQNIENRIGYIQANGGSNASGVAIDPTTGEVRALVGSADWSNPEWGKVNIATTPRQPGSSFKPIYYAAALADGVTTPATVLHDVATDFNGRYVPAPQNADRLFRGDVTVRSALAQSLNIPSIEVMDKYGIANSVKAARQLGIELDENKQYGLSLALGATEVPLIQMTNAYAAFANQGQQYTPTIIKSINNKFNKTIFTANEKSRAAISPGGAFLISSILSDNNARAPIFGSSLTVSGRTAAVKTGTTDDARDAWTIGYTPQLAVGVWVGNNNNAVMQNGGSSMAGPIWVNTMRQALNGVQNTPFTPPSDVIQKPVCYGGGLANSSGVNTYNEYFLASALPTKTCSAQQKQQEPEKQPEEEP
ncbi:MAG TPA: PBP1A family penicillin-binding protein, partial [Candidatus Saccharimonadales bacterium]|nr:PBP1A family penicillin-binding protein [Candidatus Saccharimonadales bacterium]